MKHKQHTFVIFFIYFRFTMATAAKGTQIRTFENWCNKHLDTKHLKVNNLETDFCDGTRLVALTEALSKKKIPGRVKESPNRIFWHDNVALALDFLKESEKLQLVNIGRQYVLLSYL